MLILLTWIDQQTCRDTRVWWDSWCAVRRLQSKGFINQILPNCDKIRIRHQYKIKLEHYVFLIYIYIACLYFCLFFWVSVCLCVCLFVSNKRQNSWTYGPHIFCGTSRDPRFMDDQIFKNLPVTKFDWSFELLNKGGV